tara:strand:+ start:66 stop:476 length:411 start_codon:yes stop_codon:yes gene_type:complete
MPKKSKISFGEKLYALRQSYKDKNGIPVKLSIRGAAKLLTDNGYTISHGGYALWEQPDSAIPNRAAIRAICKAFNCRPSDLFSEFWGAKTVETSRTRQFNDLDLLSDEDFKLLLNMKDTLITATIVRNQAQEEPDA